jgi:hypothetical protein
MKKKGTSNAPLILGIIGTVLNIPAAMCGAACGSILKAAGDAGDSEAASMLGGSIVAISIIAGLAGLIGGILGKPNPSAAGLLMIIATIFSGIEIFGGGGLLAFVVFILYMIGAIFCFVQKKETIG